MRHKSGQVCRARGEMLSCRVWRPVCIVALSSCANFAQLFLFAVFGPWMGSGAMGGRKVCRFHEAGSPTCCCPGFPFGEGSPG